MLYIWCDPVLTWSNSISNHKKTQTFWDKLIATKKLVVEPFERSSDHACSASDILRFWLTQQRHSLCYCGTLLFSKWLKAKKSFPYYLYSQGLHRMFQNVLCQVMLTSRRAMTPSNYGAQGYIFFRSLLSFLKGPISTCESIPSLLVPEYRGSNCTQPWVRGRHRRIQQINVRQQLYI